MKKMAIWVPLDDQSGLGHFFRSIPYFEKIEKKQEVLFFSNDENINLSTQKKANFYGLEHFPSQSIEKIYSRLLALEIKFLLIDHYFLPLGWVTFLSDKKKLTIAYYDGLFRNPSVDVLINFNLYASKKCYEYIRPNTKYFLGIENLLFRKEVYEAKEIGGKENFILICMGGSDPSGITLRLLCSLPKRMMYKVVLGSATNEEYVNKVKEKASILNIEVLHDPSCFLSLVSSAKGGIISASSMSYEFSELETPFLAIEYVENQRFMGEALRKKGIKVFGENQLSELSHIEESSFKKFKNKVVRKKQFLFTDYLSEVLK